MISFLRPLTTCALLCLALPAAARAEVTYTGTPEELRNILLADQQHPEISFSSTATKLLEAQQAEVQLKLEVEERTLNDALSALQREENRIRQALKAKGFADDAIHTQSFTSNANQGWFSDKVKSYQLNSRVSVTIRNNAEFIALASLVDGSNRVTFDGIQPQREFDQTLWADLETQAFAELKARAASYGNMSGMKLELVSFSLQRYTDARVTDAVAEVFETEVNYLSRNVKSLPGLSTGDTELKVEVTGRYRLVPAGN
ncbi:MAG: SIMPL domain-containing protein [Verrucomicrobiota bacterium JB022]|nr:SIMPL domain-containing protein [Verrucomicrobiota bacterium JB022]